MMCRTLRTTSDVDTNLKSTAVVHTLGLLGLLGLLAATGCGLTVLLRRDGLGAHELLSGVRNAVRPDSAEEPAPAHAPALPVWSRRGWIRTTLATSAVAGLAAAIGGLGVAVTALGRNSTASAADCALAQMILDDTWHAHQDPTYVPPRNPRQLSDHIRDRYLAARIIQYVAWTAGPAKVAPPIPAASTALMHEAIRHCARTTRPLNFPAALR
jgi:hypothetical protein